MAMVVKNNLSAKNTLNQLNKNEKETAKSLKKVASGMKVNSAADDASGFAISEKMRTQLRSLDQDVDNAQTGGSMLKVAEGGLQSTVDIIKTLKEKVINAANDTNTDADRQTIQKELDQAVDQIDDNANVTYNGKIMLDGSHNNSVIAGGTKTVLSNEGFDQNITKQDALVDLTDFSGRSLGIHEDSKIEMSYVIEGKTYTAILDPVEDAAFQSLFGRAKDPVTGQTSQIGNDIELSVSNKFDKDRTGAEVHTVNGGNAVIFRAKKAGLSGQISGITFNVMDHDGTINRTANSIFNNFNEVIRAEEASPDNALTFQVGTKSNQTVKIGFSDMRSVALGLSATDGSTLNISTRKNANAAISVLDLALQKTLDMQTTVGSLQSRLEYTESNLTVASENTQSSDSVIRDADMAKEMTAYTKNNVITQAAQAMLSQANQNSSQVLSLLQG